MPATKPSLSAWLAPFCLLLCAPLVMLLAVISWEAVSDAQAVRLSTLRTETSRLRHQAQRRAGHMAEGLKREPGILDWRLLREDPWLVRYWNGLEPPGQNQMYAAIVDNSGTIVMHSDPSLVGQELGRGWYDHVVMEVGSDVVHLTDSPLSNHLPAFDIRVPLVIGGREVGDYHEGLEAGRLEAAIAASQRAIWRKWLWLTGIALAVDAGAALALLMLVRKFRDVLRRCLAMAHEQATQLGVIASGLAHEIRNPLQTMRINLHALRRAHTGRAQLTSEDQMAAIDESNAAVDSLEELMRDLLRFAAPEPGSQTDLNLVAEVQATLNLLDEEMRGKHIEVSSSFPQPPVPVSMSSGRLRQMILNLLTFAEHNAGPSGRIDVAVTSRNGAAEIVVADNGPTLSPAERAHVFEPFQSARKTRSGLGLALVKSFASQAGGRVACEPQLPSGNRFRVQLPVSKS
jgi:signal transduction histidine kinase